jgi:metalloendopeptidase OMA1, mitochondrial
MNYLINQVIPDHDRSQPARQRHAGVGFLVLATLLFAACASVPHTGRRQFNLVSDSQLNAVGLKAFGEISSKEHELKDDRLKGVVKKVVDRVSKAAEAIDKPGFQWDVLVVDGDVPNAFCLPGGKIVVYSGIFPYAKTEAGLAAIVAHEVAHAVSRHGGERVSQSLALKGALSVGAEVLKGEKGTLDEKSRLLLGALGMGGTVGVILPYSRVHEFEADRIGQIYMAKAGYDPAEAVGLWGRMAKIKKPPIPVWLSTHPADEDRVRKLREFLPDAQKYYQEAQTKYGPGALL